MASTLMVCPNASLRQVRYWALPITARHCSMATVCSAPVSEALPFGLPA
jgi:hypothetical protein